MRRSLWEMSDNEIAQLLDRAIMVLDELYIRYHIGHDLAWTIQEQLVRLKRKSPEWHRVDRKLFNTKRDIEALEQRIGAQESLVASLRNEMSTRNPPFWSRYDLDRINRQR